MNENIINKARKASVRDEKKRIIKRKRKIVNLVVIFLLIVSILTNIFLIKDRPPKAPTTFGGIAYGEDYDQAYQDTYAVVEKYIKSCISHQISKDTHRTKDESGNPTDGYYYYFTKYGKNIFNNLEILINQYEMDTFTFQDFVEIFNNLSDEDVATLVIHYGSDQVEGNENKEDFKKQVICDLIKDLNTREDFMKLNKEEIAARAKGVVAEITGKLINEKYEQQQDTNTSGRGL